MGSVIELFRSWSWQTAPVLIALGLAACSADSSRFYDGSYARTGEATGSTGQPAPVARVEAQPLPQTAQVTAPTSVVRKPAAGQWSWDGGTAIVVAPGETVDSIARRHRVPPSAIMQANNLASVNSLQAGQRLVIPRYSATTIAAVPQPARAAPAPAKPVVAAGPINTGVHVVAPGETLTKIAHHYGKSLNDVAKANSIPPYAKVNIGDRIVIPGHAGGHVVAAEAAPAPSKPTQVASAAPMQSAAVVTAEPPAPQTAAKAAADPMPSFRWPVRGRIIAGFGAKPSGQQNDGINVAVPENTPIKAAEDGVVAYAGNELKGYGNLVLVRHANGYVTAYAHAKELMVKRGDPIKRGQVIAKSGQSGNVDAPQLHFEIRKGSSPVDPMQFLGGA
jgi:murein DD-endopeptidase MepM/ murein hydrolase activator NlpD